MTFDSLKIIAEVGSNWATFEDAKNSIALAKACGADAVKFQAYNHEALYGLPRPPVVPYQMPGQLPLDWLPNLKAKAEAVGIEFMCSAFSPELLDAVDPFVQTHKLASAEMSHVRILKRLKEIGKPVIMSTGGHTAGEVKRAYAMLGSTPTCIMYCVSAYPARFVNPMALFEFKGCTLGFSDHTTDIGIVAPKIRDLGALVFEKHVNFCGAQGPDSEHSLNTEEFKLYVKALRGELTASMSLGEDAMRTTHNRRLIAIQDVAIGEKLEEGINFGIFRSLKPETKALSPWAADQVEGRVAKNALAPGEGIGPFDV